MDYSGDPKFLKLIENELQTGFAFLGEATLASRKEHADEALADARRAYYAAANFLLRIPRNKILDLRGRLRDLGAAIEFLIALDHPVPVVMPAASQAVSSPPATTPIQIEPPRGIVFH